MKIKIKLFEIKKFLVIINFNFKCFLIIKKKLKNP